MTPLILIVTALIAALVAAAFLAPRRQLRTDILIDAPMEAVWPLIGDPARHGAWNPNLRQMTGRLMPGEVFTMSLGAPGARAMTFHPRVLERVEGSHVIWRGRLGVPRIFDGTHSLRVEAIGPGQTRFVNEESFTGLLLWGVNTERFRPDFEAANAGLKRVAEGQTR